MTEQSKKLNAVVTGEGEEPLVFLHGLFGHGRNFRGIANTLRLEFTSMLVDLPNHGGSAWSDHFSYEHMAAAVAELLACSLWEGRRVNVVGHSMGGKVAMLLALHYPDVIDKAVIVDISPAVSGGASEFNHLLTSLTNLDLDTVSSLGDADLKLESAIPDDRVRKFLLTNLRRSEHGYEWQANLKMLLSELPKISGWPDNTGYSFDRPVLWLAGERSPYIRPEHTEVMKRLFPKVVSATIRDAGHWVHADQQEVFITALRTFLLYEPNK